MTTKWRERERPVLGFKMNRALRAIDNWLSAWLEEESIEDRNEREAAWDFKQTNDLELLEVDPFRSEALRAEDLLATEPEAAFSLLIGMAESGSSRCMNHVAHCYDAGRGVPVDHDKALEWRRRSFEAGSTRGLLNYGHSLARRGNLEDAIRVYRVGADRDWAPALLWLANARVWQSGIKRTFREILPLLERASEQGSALARRRIAREVTLGRLGIRRIPSGFRLLRDHLQRSKAEWRGQLRR